jgi:hypothetical protein
MSAALSPAVPTAPSGISDALVELEQTHEVRAPSQLSTSSLLRLMLWQSRIECSNLDQAPTSEDQEKHEPGVTQFYENGRPLQDEEFNTAFYGHLPDGSPAFGVQHNDQPMKHQRADLQKSRPSSGIRAVPGSPAMGVRRPVVHGGSAGKHGTRYAGLRRRRSPSDVSGANVKRQRLSKPDGLGNLAYKTQSGQGGDLPGGLAAIPSSEE